jgi:hypothetical protein
LEERKEERKKRRMIRRTRYGKETEEKVEQERK